MNAENQIFLSTEEKIQIVLIVGDQHNSYRQAANIFNARHLNRNVNQTTVGRIIKKFKTTGSVTNLNKTPHVKPVTGEEGTVNVLLSAVENPKIPLSERQNDASMSVRNILKANKFKAYKPNFVHTLQERDLDARLDYCFWFQGIREDDRELQSHIIFTDEATFTSNGVVSSQNLRWWADKTPHFIIEARNQYSL